MNNGPADTLPPTFPQVEQHPDTVDTVGPYVVRIAILDGMTGDNGFHRQSATLTYEINGSPTEVDLLYSGGDVFRGEIPGQPDGTEITYRFAATDWAGNTGTSFDSQFTILASIPALLRRGDFDNDGAINALIEALYMLDFGFLGGPAPVCDDAADVDDNGIIEPLIEALYILGWGFSGGPPPAAPFPDCGTDDTVDGLDCAKTACP